MSHVILASGSPRRKELLTRICAEFDVLPADIDESSIDNETPEALVMRLAKQKAQCILDRHPLSLVIGSDTLIACDELVLGKPQNQNHFMEMMQLLSNRSHIVHTAVACLSQQQSLYKIVSTDVSFAQITPQQATAYWQSGEPQGKAGGYAIQGLGEQFVKSINGSYSAVVGLPLYETKQMLEVLL